MAFVQQLFYVRVVSKITPDIFGCIPGVEDESALTPSPVVGSWNDGSSRSVKVLVDSGASEHNLDDAIIPGLRNKLDRYRVLDVPRKLITADGG